MEETGFSCSQRLPKNFITPWVLLVLKQWNLHGYLILQQLERMGFAGVDHATLYRELRRLEREGYVASEWETGESGPARRVYSITDAGEEMLRGWTEVVSGYQRMINGFFDLYSQVFGFPPPAEPEEKDNNSETTGGLEIMNPTQELFKAYGDMVSSGFAAFNMGLQQNNALVNGMLETNVKLAEASQEVVKSAIKYGETYMEWSLETANGTKS